VTNLGILNRHEFGGGGTKCLDRVNRVASTLCTLLQRRIRRRGLKQIYSGFGTFNKWLLHIVCSRGKREKWDNSTMVRRRYKTANKRVIHAQCTEEERESSTSTTNRDGTGECTEHVHLEQSNLEQSNLVHLGDD